MKYDVVIIDTGITESQENYCDCIEIKNGNISKSVGDKYNHGSIIVDILRKRNIGKLLMIKMDPNEFDEKLLLEVLLYIYDNIRCKIINLSFGLYYLDEKEKLFKLIDLLNKKGTFLVAAYDNDGCVTYPASLQNVIGVDIENETYSLSKYKFIENSIVNILFSGRTQIIQGEPVYGSSFVAPILVSEIINNIWYKEINMNELLQKLKINSFKTIEYCKINDKKIDLTHWKETAIFPLSKETRNVLLHSNLNFEVIFDHIYSGNVGKNLKSISIGQSDKTIKDVKDYKKFKFDSLVLGHTSELRDLIGSKIINELLLYCIDNKIPIYSFDKLNVEYDKLYTPNIYFENQEIQNMGKLYHISKPILSILGTSSVQGKFNLQMNIANTLKKKGASIEQFITEPGAELYGISASLPMGYNSDHSISYKSIAYINNELEKIADKSDMIICGGQSFVLHGAYHNIRNFSLESCEFLLGTNSDGVILVVNYDDQYQRIEDCINFIQSFSQSTVIAVSIFNYKRKFNEKDFNVFIKIEDALLSKKCKEITEKFKIPAYSASDFVLLTDKIIDYFTE